MKITCIVDNAVQRSSSFWGEHGLAFLIETEAGRVLFDTGQSGTVLLHNLETLGVDPVTIDALALSHAHYDHTGGLPALLERVRPGIPLYANADLLRERFSRWEGEPQSMGLSLTREELATRVTLHLSETPQEILPGVWTTGEITSRPEPEGRSARHLVREGDTFVPDPYQDDMALVLECRGTVTVPGDAVTVPRGAAARLQGDGGDRVDPAYLSQPLHRNDDPGAVHRAPLPGGN